MNKKDKITDAMLDWNEQCPEIGGYDEETNYFIQCGKHLGHTGECEA